MKYLLCYVATSKMSYHLHKFLLVFVILLCLVADSTIQSEDGLDVFEKFGIVHIELAADMGTHLNESLNESVISKYKPSLRTIFTGKEITDVVNQYNFHRRSVGASNMQRLSWHHDLAESMHFAYFNCRTNDSITLPAKKPDRQYQKFEVVANLNGTVTATYLKGLVDYINLFSKTYDYSNNSCTPSNQTECLIYRAMMEASNTYVGCTYQRCTTINDVSIPGEVVIFGCMFNHSASVTIGTNQPYLKGNACSQCSSATPGCQDSLCVSCATNCGRCEIDRNCRCMQPCRGSHSVTLIGWTLLLSIVMSIKSFG